MSKKKMSPAELKKFCEEFVKSGEIFKAMQTMDVELISSSKVERGKPLIIFNPELLKPPAAHDSANQEHEKPDHAEKLKCKEEGSKRGGSGPN